MAGILLIPRFFSAEIPANGVPDGIAHFMRQVGEDRKSEGRCLLFPGANSQPGGDSSFPPKGSLLQPPTGIRKTQIFHFPPHHTLACPPVARGMWVIGQSCAGDAPCGFCWPNR